MEHINSIVKALPTCVGSDLRSDAIELLNYLHNLELLGERKKLLSTECLNCRYDLSDYIQISYHKGSNTWSYINIYPGHKFTLKFLHNFVISKAFPPTEEFESIADVKIMLIDLMHHQDYVSK